MIAKAAQLRKKIENYSYGLNDHLDENQKSNIFKGINEQNDERVSIKVVDLRNPGFENVKELIGYQIEALKHFKHPNIIQCYDVYSTVNNCYIITQFCQQGDLQNLISARKTISEREAINIFKDLLTGYLYLVQEKYTHGNLKPSCLLIKQKVVKISGFSNCRKNGAKEIKRQTIKFNNFQSPESVRDDQFTTKSDIWSLAMILYVMLHGRLPWQYTNKAQFLQNCNKPFIIHQQLSPDVRSFLQQCLTDSHHRINIQSFRIHPFVDNIINFYHSSDKYLVIPVANQFIQPNCLNQKNKKDAHYHNINRTEKQITCQINWMRFLFRLFDKFQNASEQQSSLRLRCIILRQLCTQYEELKRALLQQINTFDFINWELFLQQTQKINKYADIIRKNQVRYEKTKYQFNKIVDKIQIDTTLSKISNENYIYCQFNSFIAISFSVEQIKKIWFKIRKDYGQNNYTKQVPFKYKNQLLLLDFIITYYQLNCLLIDDFHKMDYFQKMSKLDIILDINPVELDITALSQFQNKLVHLGLFQ